MSSADRESNDHYAVIGQAIAYSRSPEIHAQFARQTHQNMDYARIDVPPALFSARARAFFATRI